MTPATTPSSAGATLLGARWPRPADAARARLGLERWSERGAQAADPAARLFAAELASDPGGRAMLEAVFGNSPFLGQCLVTEPAFVGELITEGTSARFGRLLDDARVALAGEEDQSRLSAELRRMRRRAALTIALADIAGIWPLDQVTAALSDLAETALRLAVGHLLRRAAAGRQLDLPDPADPARGSGLVVLGMGKLGARELNYSSDIDLIVLYDETMGRARPAEAVARTFVRLTRDLVRIMEERTRDGYVFRTDLRLRPDPSATPPAVSIGAAETYYGSMALNWERAAMIKARAVAGDAETAAAFLGFVRQFVWRRDLDFAMVEDIRRIKRQIHRHHGHGALAIHGHDIKLGRGGIREIEFYAQTQQLIFGGREPRLRTARTCEGLAALAATGRIPAEAATGLTEAYGFLRRVEHRLQMIEDRQTQELPADEAGLDALATFLGYDPPATFRTELRATLGGVEQICAGLFAGWPPESQTAGAGQVGDRPAGAITGQAPAFSGPADTPETLAALTAMGFANPEGVAAAVRGWMHGRYRATRSERAQHLLGSLLPILLQALAATPSPDAALFRFDEFLARLPTGVQLFSLFQANPRLLDLVAEIMGTSRRLADHLAHHPAQLDAVLTPGFFDPLPDAAQLAAGLDDLLGAAADYEEVLTTVRRWTNDQRFRAGLHLLRNRADAAVQGAFLSDVAEAALRALLPRVEAEFARRHGGFGAPGLAMIAMGKLGGREMTVRSDLDLIVVFAADLGADQSDGPVALPPTAYFARLSQRLISAITAPTRDGPLYEVDMRLRPSGNAGPLATGLDGFTAYHRDSAWTWEHMALTRARVIAGPPDLAQQIEAAIAAVLRRPRAPDALRRDVAEMRGKIEAEHPGRDPWEVKYRRGGLIDIEFIAQTLQLRHAAEIPEVLDPNTAGALRRLAAAGVLDPGWADELIAALHLWQRVQAYLRLTLDGKFDPDAAPAPLRDGLARFAFPDEPEPVPFAAVEDRMSAMAARAHGIFRELIGPTAGE